MGTESNFELWLVVAIVAVFAGMFLSYLLVELPGRILIMSLSNDRFEPTKALSRAVGLGAWTVIFLVIYAVMG